MKGSGVSVIVCCYNSESRIELTLQHLIGQRVDPSLGWEIIVIDNGSNDGTSRTASSFLLNHANSIQWKVVAEPRPGLSNARKRGFDEARFNIVLMVDDDNSLAPNYIDGIWTAFIENPQAGMVGGMGVAKLENEAPTWFKTYDYCFAVGPQTKPSSSGIEYLYGAGLALRMDVLEQIRAAGFESLLSDRIGNSLMSGGDTELCFAYRMAGYKLIYRPELTFIHHLSSDRINWSYLRRLFSGFGHTKAYMDIYVSAISGKALPVDGRLPFWLNRVIYLTKDLTKDLPILIKGSIYSLEGNDQLLVAIAKRGHLRRIIWLRKEYLSMFQKVFAFRDNIQE